MPLKQSQRSEEAPAPTEYLEQKRDRLFAGPTADGDFEFNEEVAEVFDDMVRRSVPFYDEQQHMVCEIGRRLYKPGTSVYDLGCSTGTTLITLARALKNCRRLVGYDNSRPMLERARRKVSSAGFNNCIELRFGDLNGDVERLEFEGAGLVTLCWTLQFVRPPRRDRLIRWIYDGLVEGGALIVTEKVLADDSCLNRLFIELYYGFKNRNGYSSDEIRRKREALENVLVPYRISEDLELFRGNGFEVAETFFQWHNFAGFVCVKKPAPAGSAS